MNARSRAAAEMIAEMRDRPDTGLVVKIARGTWDACLRIADAYLAEHAADEHEHEHEPATAEWMMTLPGASKLIYRVAVPTAICNLSLYTVNAPVFDKGTWVLGSHAIWPGQTVTRGMVRRLIEALKGGG